AAAQLEHFLNTGVENRGSDAMAKSRSDLEREDDSESFVVEIERACDEFRGSFTFDARQAERQRSEYLSRLREVVSRQKDLGRIDERLKVGWCSDRSALLSGPRDSASHTRASEDCVTDGQRAHQQRHQARGELVPGRPSAQRADQCS